MADKSKIPWTESTWNPFRGCMDASPGCKNCYAKRMAARNLPGHKSPTTGEPFAIMTSAGPRWTGKVELIESQMDIPLRWRRPRRIFVNSMSDTWHKGFLYEQVADVVETTMAAPQHTYLFLTKRPALAREFWDKFYSQYNKAELDAETMDDCAGRTHRAWPPAPFRNVWMGASAEDQQRFDERVEHLRATPAAVRWLSLEPLLVPIDLKGKLDGIHWVVVGGESGPGARPCDIQWIRDIVRQCREAGVACFVKQLGASPVIGACRQHHWDFGGAIGRVARFSALDKAKPSSGLWLIHFVDRPGADPAEWPLDLRVREYPPCQS